MRKHYGRLLFCSLVLMWALAAPCIGAGVAFDGGNTLNATANSVWNMKATYSESHDWWPLYMADLDEETIQADPASTIDREAVDISRHGWLDWPASGGRWEWDVDDQRMGIMAANWLIDPDDLLRAPYPAPPPPTTVTRQNGDVVTTTWIYDPGGADPTAAPQIPTVALAGCNRQQQVYIPRHTIRRIEVIVAAADGAVTTVETVWECPPVIVPEYAFLRLRSVAIDASGSPALSADMYAANGAFCTQTRIVDGVPEEPTSAPEPVWAQSGVQATVIVINGSPDTQYPVINRIYYNYTRRGEAQIATGKSRLPNPYVVYTVPVTNSLDGSATIKLNYGLFDGVLDPNRGSSSSATRIANVNNADPRDPTRPGPYSPLLGVFDNASCTGTNYWRPGNYSESRYGIITIPADIQPEGGWKDWTNLYVKVSTFPVDAVWNMLEERQDPRYPKRINYFRKPEWMPGVVTGAWPNAPQAYSVKPDVAPDKVRMRAVTGIYVPQLVNGTVLDSTHVQPRDASRVKTVLAVYSLKNMDGTRLDATHVQPADPSLISFVSGVYAIDTKPAAPIDPMHVVPTDATVLDRMSRVRRVYVPSNPGKNYYDFATPFAPGDTEINLVEALPVGTSTVQVEFESPDLYDTENPAIAYHQGDPILTLNLRLPADSTAVKIVYGEGSGLDGFNYYDPNNEVTAFHEGDTSVTLKTALPEGTTDVRILFGTDVDLKTRGSGTPGGTSVTPSNIWTIARVKGMYAIHDAMSAIKLNNTTITPYDPTAIREVLGVYPAKEMGAQVAEDTSRIKALNSEPTAFLAIRRVRGVYAREEQLGSPGAANPDGSIRTAVPSNPDMIARVFRVYANGKDYYDPDNPEATYRTGDPFIKLSTALDAGVTSLTIEYETINLVTNPATAFAQGGDRVVLDTPLPDANPISIRLAYSANGSLYNPASPSVRFTPGDTQIVLDTALTASDLVGVYEFDVVYADGINRACVWEDITGTAPEYAPGEEQIPLVAGQALPADSTGALVEYSAHLFSRAYDPMDYDPNNPATASLRPFIPGDTTIRLNRLDPNVELPLLFRVPGALKLCIAYQSDKQPFPHEMGNYSVGGDLDLPVPLPVSRPNVYITYRIMSNYVTSVGEDNNPIYAGGTYTVSRPYMGYATWHSLLPPPGVHGWDFHTPLPPISSAGRFTARCLSEDPPTPAGAGATATVRYRRREPDSNAGVLWVTGIGGNYLGRIPMYFIENAPSAGSVYKVAASAGLNMSHPKQQPSCNLEEGSTMLANRLLIDQHGNPMWYAPGLVANGDGTPKTIDSVGVVGWYYDEEAGNFASVNHSQKPTVHDSRASFWSKYWGEMIDYGGQDDDKDWLESYPELGSTDPLIPEPPEEIVTAFPDDGSSSTQFVFRVRYRNDDGLPPLPWLTDLDDPWNLYDGRATGVVLYLDEKGTGDYQPHFMALEDPKKNPVGGTYIYRVLPHHMFRVRAEKEPLAYPWNDAVDTYQSLSCGVYHYFFACSDDSLKFDNGDLLLSHQLDPSEWGDSYTSYLTNSSSTGLDPSLARTVTGFGEINRPAKRRYGASQTGLPFDPTIYVDRPVLVPGLYQHTGYPLPADQHPRVTCSLGMPPYDDLNVAYDDTKYGRGRFFGTIYPYSSMVNPEFSAVEATSPYDPTYYGVLLLAQTCGVPSQTETVFRVLYRQIDNKAPIYMRVLINNASVKSGTGPEYAYTAYSMEPSASQTKPYDYRAGVWYQYKVKLPPGPHTYYFQAYDGEHVVRFPVRPDLYYYGNDDDPGWWGDAWVPTSSTSSERTVTDDTGKVVPNPAYFDNDYFPGPYVNHPVVLSEATVTPGQGKEGQSFRYRVKYQDADGHRPLTGYVYIEVNDKGKVERFAMRPETPFVDPAGDHRQEYKDGVYYVLDTGTINDFALENGVRRFYFEFTDDWGPYYDLNESIPGETTRYPQGAGNWVTGPVISGNRAPTLYQGSVTSQDGTANAATLWTFKATYRDLDNDAPALVKVFIGLLQPDGKTVLWDAGHTMAQTNPADKNYADGAEFYFQTRLGASETSSTADLKQYFYAFEAYDGGGWATYNSSSNEEKRSNAAGCVVLDDLTRIDSLHYRIVPTVSQQCVANSLTQVTPDNPADVLKVRGVYTTEDLTGTNYCDTGSDPEQYDGGAITLTTPLPAGSTRAWLKYEPQAPIVGPLPIDLPAPTGVLPDAQIYEDYTTTPTAILIDDQKNGWINPDPNYPDDRGTLVMRGIATFEGQASVKFVTPDSPSDIASVEGVYLTPDLTGENYYDPEALEPPMIRTGKIDPADVTRRTVLPDDPDRIDLVSGVFDINDESMSGVNYYLGEGYPSTVSWQEALILGASYIYSLSGIYVSGNTVWPKNPYDIVSIAGVYPAMDLATTNHYRPDGMAAQPCSASGIAVQVAPEMVGDTKSIVGVYLSPTATGTNYYDATRPWNEGDFLVNVSSTFFGGSAYIQYVKADGSVAVAQGGTLYVVRVQPADPNPFIEGQAGLISGVYKTVSYDTAGKPVGSGTNYAVGAAIDRGEIPLSTPLQYSSFTTMYVIYTNPPFGFGPYGEYIGLSKTVDRSSVRSMFVAYYPRGTVKTVNQKKYITLSRALPAGVDEVNIRCIAKAFDCGDSVIPLTKDLPTGTSTVYVKYSDIRFTHQLRGDATEPDSTWNSLLGSYWQTGTTHWSPDGWNTGQYDPDTGEPIGEANVHIKSNETNITDGVIGVWENALRDGRNYFKPRYATRHADNPLHLRLTAPAPEGTWYVWGRYYQKGDYHIDRWNRDVFFLSEKDGTKPIQASYFFGTKMPQALGANTSPQLSEGKVIINDNASLLKGGRGDKYTYSVVYRDLDGPNGQAPTYVRVYIDGVARDMTPAVSGTPAFREGAVYTYTVPDGLAGGSHKFRFEASDGAAIAWFDANGAHESTAGEQPASGVVDIDGPWVNDPPQLSDGLATPNPTTGGINPWDSVDYTVIYQDADNDEPYFYDPVRDVLDYDSNKNGIMDGPEWSGSPRLWIDSGKVDQYFTGKVAALEDDLMGQGKKRTIVADGSPGWVPDQFAGALMQITNGAISGRVYLIQSNTDNRLVLATEDLAKDGVVVGGTNATQFRINGLLMNKADATQQDFTLGVKYKLTVPKLSVGTHSFHFTARSREAKPQWLIGSLQAQDRVPYSGEVRYPTTGDEAGPTVVSNPPQGNSAPVVALTAESQRDDPKDPVFVGPAAQIALARNANEVEAFYPTLFAQIREVRGVFLNANDIDLSSLVSASEAAESKYDPKTTTTPFKPGDTKIALTSALSAVAEGTELVQFGNVDSNSLLRVTPDARAIINSVAGVYLTSDPALAGPNYYAAGSTTGTYDGTNVNLVQPLPSGTKRVYIKYRYKAVTAGSQWPVPVYVKYFTNTTVRKFKSSDLVTFRANYRDADNDAPNYHDSVQGYIKLVFNTSGQGRQMQLLNPPAAGEAVNYRVDLPFSTVPLTLPEGTHKYHIEASDGYYVVRFPSGTLGDPAANDYTITVNRKPVLTAGKVDPAIGQTATTFTFTVTYRDQDGTTTAPPTVSVRITRLDAAWEEAHDMTATSSSPNYPAGVDYVYSKKGLAAGTYKAVFEATDGDGEDAAPYPAEGQTQILFSVRDTNETPEITSLSVLPAAGGINKLFSYRAQYRDKDGDAPISKTDGAKDVMTLIIDEGTAAEQTLRMTKAAGEPASPDYWNDGNGVAYQTTQSISGKKLGSGRHTYTVVASDGTADTGLLMTGQVDVSDALLKTVTPKSPNIIGSVVGVYRELDLRGKTNYFVSADGAMRGQFTGGKIKLARSLPSGTKTVYVQYALPGPILLIPYFVNFRAVPAGSAAPEAEAGITQAVVGEEILFVGSMKFPDNPVSNPPTEISNITIQVTKPDGTSVSLSARVSGYQEEFETLADGTKRRTGWVGKIQASYPKGVDSSLLTGSSLTLIASGEWTAQMSWPGDSSWDRTDTTGNGVTIAVGGQMRTIAVADPANPGTSTPAIDMITVPKVLGSTDVGRVFGYERALDMQIVRWDTASRTYFRYGVQGSFPDLLPGEALWIKPKASYPSESVTQKMVDDGLLGLGNPESPFYPRSKYRLIKAFVKDYTKDVITGETEPCTIALKSGWNQFGSIFFNWKRNTDGSTISPRIDVGTPLSELSVRYLNDTKSLADAAAAGWVRGYAWRWDAPSKQYVLVHPSMSGAERVIKAWSGCWIRAFVDCELVVPGTTRYNGEALAAASKPNGLEAEAAAGEQIEPPPPAPE